MAPKKIQDAYRQRDAPLTEVRPQDCDEIARFLADFHELAHNSGGLRYAIARLNVHDIQKLEFECNMWRAQSTIAHPVEALAPSCNSLMCNDWNFLRAGGVAGAGGCAWDAWTPPGSPTSEVIIVNDPIQILPRFPALSTSRPTRSSTPQGHRRSGLATGPGLRQHHFRGGAQESPATTQLQTGPDATPASTRPRPRPRHSPNDQHPGQQRFRMASSRLPGGRAGKAWRSGRPMAGGPALMFWRIAGKDAFNRMRAATTPQRQRLRHRPRQRRTRSMAKRRLDNSQMQWGIYGQMPRLGSGRLRVSFPLVPLIGDHAASGGPARSN